MTLWSVCKCKFASANLIRYFHLYGGNSKKGLSLGHLKKWMSSETTQVASQDVPPKKPKQFSEVTQTPIVAYIFPIACFFLGTWQLYRHRRRDNLIQHSIDNMNGPAMDKLPKCIARNLFKRVRVEGEFLFDEVAKVGPCQFLEGCNHNSIADFHAYVPFKLKSNGKTIFVDLGLLRHNETPAFNEYCQMHKGDTVVEGYLRRLYMRTLPNCLWCNAHFLACTLTSKRLWLLHNYGQYYIQKAPVKDHVREAGEPLTYVPEVDHYNIHTEYVLFWYILSAILFYSIYRGRRKPLSSA